jgi:hypothetical protein
MLEIASLPDPVIVLPQQEHDGAVAWWGGTRFMSESAADGFAFCPYEFGTLEHDNWVAGYASQALNPELVKKQMSEQT